MFSMDLKVQLRLSQKKNRHSVRPFTYCHFDFFKCSLDKDNIYIVDNLYLLAPMLVSFDVCYHFTHTHISAYDGKS